MLAVSADSWFLFLPAAETQRVGSLTLIQDAGVRTSSDSYADSGFQLTDSACWLLDTDSGRWGPYFLGQAPLAAQVRTDHVLACGDDGPSSGYFWVLY